MNEDMVYTYSELKRAIELAQKENEVAGFDGDTSLKYSPDQVIELINNNHASSKEI